MPAHDSDRPRHLRLDQPNGVNDGVTGGGRRKLRQHRDAESRFDEAKRTGEVSDLIGPVQLQAVSRERIVDQRAIAAVATDGDDPV